MLIPINCTCGKSLKVKPEYAGKRVRCPNCSVILPVPIATPAQPEQPAEHSKAGQLANQAGAAIQGIGSSIAGFLKKKPQPEESDQQPQKTDLFASRHTVFEHLTAQKQDPSIVEKVVERVEKILTASEELRYIAIQQRPLINWAPDCIVVTNRRVILYQPKMLGRVDMQDYVWRKIQNVKLKENMIGATLIFSTVENNQLITLDYLPKEQARELYRIAQEQEEAVQEERRLRRMEEDRARSGGVQIMQQIGTTPSHAGTAPVDPVQKLQQLKQLLEAGLLTESEYESKRAEIIRLL